MEGGEGGVEVGFLKEGRKCDNNMAVGSRVMVGFLGIASWALNNGCLNSTLIYCAFCRIKRQIYIRKKFFGRRKVEVIKSRR